MGKYNKAFDKKASAEIDWLVKSVTRMVRPVVRLCVGRMSCNAFINVVKRIYVEEATTYLERENSGKKVTKSALALLSGLDSRAIDGIMQENTEPSTAADIRPEAAILEAWAADETYRSPGSEKPMVLPIFGRGLTFQTLVSRVAGRNVTCRTVLEKLIHSNNVRVVDENFVELLHRSYLPVSASERELLETGSAAIGRIARTVSHNMEVDDCTEKWLQQDRWSVKIPCDKLEMLKSDIRSLVETHIQSAEEVLESYEDPVKTRAHCSAGLGWYYWESTPDY